MDYEVSLRKSEAHLIEIISYDEWKRHLEHELHIDVENGEENNHPSLMIR